MNKGKVGYFILDVINKALPFIIIPYVTSKVSLHDYGMIDIFVSSYIFLGFIFGFGFEGWLSANFYKKKKKYIFNIVKTYLLYVFFLSMFVFSIFFNINSLYSYVVIIAFVNSVMMVVTTLFRLDDKFLNAGLLLFINSLVNVVLLVLLFYMYKPSYELRVYSLLFSALFTIFLLFVALKLFYKEIFYSTFEKNDFLPVLSFCLPLCVSMLSSWLKGNIDKFYINMFLNQGELAIYSLAFQISSVINVLVVTINKIYQPSFFKQKSKGISQYQSMCFIFLLIIVLSIVYYFVIYNIFDYLFDERYVLSLSYMPELLLSFSVSAIVMILNNLILYSMKSRYIMYQVVITSLFHSILSYHLLISYGSIGVVYAQLISSLLSLLLTVFFLRKIIGNN